MKNLLPDVRQAMRAAVLGVATATTALPIMDAIFGTETSTARAQDDTISTYLNLTEDALAQLRQDRGQYSLYNLLRQSTISPNVSFSKKRLSRRVLNAWNSMGQGQFDNLSQNDHLGVILCVTDKLTDMGNARQQAIPSIKFNNENIALHNLHNGLRQLFVRPSGFACNRHLRR
jgi:hypothetical protein